MSDTCHAEGCSCPAWFHALWTWTPGEYVRDITPSFAEVTRRFQYSMISARVIGRRAWQKRQPKLDRYGSPWPPEESR